MCDKLEEEGVCIAWELQGLENPCEELLMLPPGWKEDTTLPMLKLGDPQLKEDT